MIKTATLSLFIGLLAALFAPLAQASDSMQGSVEQSEQPSGKAGYDYIALEDSFINFRNIGLSSRRAVVNSAAIVLGTYLTNYFKLEMRFAQGLNSSSAEYPGLKVRLKHYISWYLGVRYPILSYADVYAQFGFSSVYAKATLGSNTSDYPKVDGGLLNSSFSKSWLIGTDVKLIKHTFFVLEFGRLHDDTKTNISTYQINTGIRYEF